MKRNAANNRAAIRNRRPSTAQAGVIPIAVKAKSAKRRVANDDNLAAIPVAVTDEASALNPAAAVRKARQTSRNVAVMPVAVQGATERSDHRGQPRREKHSRRGKARASRKSANTRAARNRHFAKAESHPPEKVTSPLSKPLAEANAFAKNAVDMFSQYGYLAIDACQSLLWPVLGAPQPRDGKGADAKVPTLEVVKRSPYRAAALSLPKAA